jgi:hypothetical protein
LSQLPQSSSRLAPTPVEQWTQLPQKRPLAEKQMKKLRLPGKDQRR